MLAFKGKGESVPLRTAVRLALVYPGLRATLLHRLAYATHRARIPIVPMILTNLNLSLHGFDIPPHIEVGPRFYVPHPVGTVVTARRLGAGITLVIINVLFASFSTFNKPGPSNTLLIYNVNVIDVRNGKIAANKAILITNNRIEKIADYASLQSKGSLHAFIYFC